MSAIQAFGLRLPSVDELQRQRLVQEHGKKPVRVHKWGLDEVESTVLYHEVAKIHAHLMEQLDTWTQIVESAVSDAEDRAQDQQPFHVGWHPGSVPDDLAFKTLAKHLVLQGIQKAHQRMATDIDEVTCTGCA